MNRDQINRLEMFQATNTYLDAQVEVWTAIPIVSTYKTALVTLIQEIESTSLEQDAAQVFIGSSLRALKRQIALKMDILDDTLEAYAEDTENAELLAQASNTVTDYFSLTNEDFEIKTKNMIDLLDASVAEMADYGMTAPQLEEVKTSFGLFQDKRGTPRSYRIASKVATSDLVTLFAEANITVNRLDKVLKRFKRSNASFYQGYLAARTIVST